MLWASRPLHSAPSPLHKVYCPWPSSVYLKTKVSLFLKVTILVFLKLVTIIYFAHEFGGNWILLRSPSMEFYHVEVIGAGVLRKAPSLILVPGWGDTQLGLGKLRLLLRLHCLHMVSPQGGSRTANSCHGGSKVKEEPSQERLTEALWSHLPQFQNSLQHHFHPLYLS